MDTKYCKCGEEILDIEKQCPYCYNNKRRRIVDGKLREDIPESVLGLFWVTYKIAD